MEFRGQGIQEELNLKSTTLKTHRVDNSPLVDPKAACQVSAVFRKQKATGY